MLLPIKNTELIYVFYYNYIIFSFSFLPLSSNVPLYVSFFSSSLLLFCNHCFVSVYVNSYPHTHAHTSAQYILQSLLSHHFIRTAQTLATFWVFVLRPTSEVFTLAKEISFATNRDHQRKPQPSSADLLSLVPAGIYTVQFLHLTLSNHCKRQGRKTVRNRGTRSSL